MLASVNDIFYSIMTKSLGNIQYTDCLLYTSVCVMRHIPIFTFVNKMDREARDPFELMSEIEEVLGIHTCPINWPIGCGKNFKGVYDRQTKQITTFTAAMGGQKEVASRTFDVEGADVDSIIVQDYHAQLREMCIGDRTGAGLRLLYGLRRDHPQ